MDRRNEGFKEEILAFFSAAEDIRPSLKLPPTVKIVVELASLEDKLKGRIKASRGIVVLPPYLALA